MRSANFCTRFGLLVASTFAVHAQEPVDHSHAHHAAAKAQANTAQAEKPEQDASSAHAHHGSHAMTQPVEKIPTDEPKAFDHVAPDPPQHVMAPMSDAEMTRVMAMDDTASIFKFKLDTFERAKSDDAWSTAWNAQASYGGDFDKLLLRSEGDREHGATDARVEAFWNHAFASYWDWQLGVRRDFGSGPARNWAAFGVQGLAPYWFEVEAAAYLGENGRTALGLRAEYELLLTQRLILQPELELNFYGKNDRARDVAAGLSDAEFGLRLRYEIRREFAPYVGVVWKHRGETSGVVPPFVDRGGTERQVVAGLRLWF